MVLARNRCEDKSVLWCLVTLQRQPFEPVRLEDERAEDKGRVFTVRFNEADIEALNELKGLYGLDSDNGTIRAAVLFALNVTRAHFAGGLADTLFKKKRPKR